MPELLLEDIAAVVPELSGRVVAVHAVQRAEGAELKPPRQQRVVLWVGVRIARAEEAANVF